MIHGTCLILYIHLENPSQNKHLINHVHESELHNMEARQVASAMLFIKLWGFLAWDSPSFMPQTTRLHNKQGIKCHVMVNQGKESTSGNIQMSQIQTSCCIHWDPIQKYESWECMEIWLLLPKVMPTLPNHRRVHGPKLKTSHFDIKWLEKVADG